jgi:hypothetical protein
MSIKPLLLRIILENTYVVLVMTKKSNSILCKVGYDALVVLEYDFGLLCHSGETGYEAANVTGPNGGSVQGSKYAPDRRQYNTRGGFGRGRGRGQPPMRPRGGPFRGMLMIIFIKKNILINYVLRSGGFDPNYGPPFSNFGPPPMVGRPPFGRPPRGGLGGPMIRGMKFSSHWVLAKWIRVRIWVWIWKFRFGFRFGFGVWICF